MHMTFRRGKRVRVVLRTGESFVDRWRAKGSDAIQFQEHGWVRVKDIRATSIAKAYGRVR